MRLAVLALAAVLAGCQALPVSPTKLASAPTRPSPPSAQPSASQPIAAPTLSPALPSESSGGFRTDAFVQVSTDDLRVRTKPGVSDDSVQLEPLLRSGDVAMVLGGPVEASGFEWYLIKPLGAIDLEVSEGPPEFGWVAAAGQDGEPWLIEWTIGCPSGPLDGLVGDASTWPPQELVALSCFGDGQALLTADLQRVPSGCVEAPAWRIEPAWLDPCNQQFQLLGEISDDGEVPTLPVAMHPALRLDGLAPIAAADTVFVYVDGQYDHPDARVCRAVPDPVSSEPEPPAELVTLTCRSRFVVTAISSAEE
jgi:hypothetical protein